MENRINLTPSTLIRIPIAINDRDFDLDFDVESFAFMAALPKMSDCIMKFRDQMNIENLNNGELDNKWNETQQELSDLFCSFCPIFKEATAGQRLSFKSWMLLLNAIKIHKAEIDGLISVVKEINEQEQATIHG